jgi:hypothetical protein
MLLEKVNVDEIVRNIINIIDVPYNSVVSIKINACYTGRSF